MDIRAAEISAILKDQIENFGTEADVAEVGQVLSVGDGVARAYGLDVLDGVYNEFRDTEGFRDECEKSRILGMDGKTLIHPSQVGPCNEIFSPTEDEVEWSRKVIDAFGQPENEKKGVIVVDGQMVERLHFTMAQRVVVIADQIRALEASIG